MGKLPAALRERVTWLDEQVGVLSPAPGLAQAGPERSGPRRGPRPPRERAAPTGPAWPYGHSLIVDDGDVMLVGAGLPREVCESFAPYVDALILTTTHRDHALHADAFSATWVPVEEAEALASPDGFCRVHGVQRADRSIVRDWLARCEFVPSKPARAYTPGGLIRLSATRWQFLTLPGLSPGYTCLYEPERRILFAPTLEGLTHGLEAPFYGFPACDLEAIETMTTRLQELEVAYLVGSHAPVRRRGIRALLQEIPQTIRKREMRVVEAFATPASISEVAERGVFFELPEGDAKAGEIVSYWERIMADKHMANLMERDLLAARQDGRFERV